MNGQQCRSVNLLFDSLALPISSAMRVAVGRAAITTAWPLLAILTKCLHPQIVTEAVGCKRLNAVVMLFGWWMQLDLV